MTPWSAYKSVGKVQLVGDHGAAAGPRPDAATISLNRFTDVESDTTTSSARAPISAASLAPIRWLAVNHPSPHPRMSRPPHPRSTASLSRGPPAGAAVRASCRRGR